MIDKQRLDALANPTSPVAHVADAVGRAAAASLLEYAATLMEDFDFAPADALEQIGWSETLSAERVAGQVIDSVQGLPPALHAERAATRLLKGSGRTLQDCTAADFRMAAASELFARRVGLRTDAGHGNHRTPFM